MPLADTLLRMAEAPQLYFPRWSKEIMDEVTRNLVEKWNVEPGKARRREDAMRRHFPEAWVDDYERLIPVMTNQVKDRHVLAAAVRSNAELIITYNGRDFPGESLCPWGIEVLGPSTFLRGLYDLDSGLVVRKLYEQAEAIGIPMVRFLASLSRNVPGFVRYFCEEQQMEVSAPLG